ncbi:putative cytochrome P450 oxidoreductase GliC-like protein [Xylaria arbuscula]|nr:putative cytochrome P450 oxidoreductase GliC-like protein [Xylaria arbuscula]
MRFSHYDLLVASVGVPVLVSMLTGAAIIVIVVTLHSSAIQARVKQVLSFMINIILLRCNPIKHIEQSMNLPTLPYHFPNGQGNVEKFLKGRKNSEKWEREYGSLYRLWSGMKGEIVLTKTAHVEAIFKDSHNHIKAPANDSGYLMNQLLGSCLGLISGQSWSAVKSSVEAPFSRRSIGPCIHDVQHFTSEYMRRLSNENDTFGKEGKLQPVHDLKLLPFSFIAKVVYGPLSQKLERELMDLVPPREAVFRAVISGGLTRFAISRFLHLPAIRALRDFKDRWARWNDRAHAHAQSLEESGGRSAPIIGIYRAVKNGEMTREQLLQTLDEILFANIDVTMGGLSWAIVFIAANSAVQEALRSEIREHSFDSATRDAYLRSSWNTTPTLLGACIMEAARLRPVAAFSVPQACPSPRILDGFEIPAGTNFVIDSYALNIRDPFWGLDGDRYRPERWLELHEDGRDLRYRYWRFGFGPRTCLGKYLADLILRSVVIEIVEHWKVKLDETAKEDEKVVDKDVSMVSNPVMNWPWDDELWIHSPDLLLKCEPLSKPLPRTPT